MSTESLPKPITKIRFSLSDLIENQFTDPECLATKGRCTVPLIHENIEDLFD